MRLAYSAACGSWARFNPHLRQTLHSAIVMEMHFEPDDFATIAAKFRGGYWMTDDPCRTFYDECIQWNPSALKAFERYWGIEKPFLWEIERGKVQRLSIGSEFVWKGVKVKVTTLRGDTLVACHYKPGPTAGACYTRDGYRVFEKSDELDGGGIVFTYGPKVDSERTKVLKRFTITADALKAERVRCAKIVKAVIAEINKATLEELSGPVRQIAVDAAKDLRHTDVEDIHAAFSARKKKLQGEIATCDQDDAFRAGRIRWVEAVQGRGALLRLSADGRTVETSNGHHAPTAEAREALPPLLCAMAHKRERRKLIGKTLGFHSIEKLDDRGVTVGCTFFEWTELENLNKQISA